MSRPLFGALDEVGNRLAQAQALLLCLDFDGSIAPLAEDPAEVEIPPKARQAIAALASSDAVRVAIISGRERNDLKLRVGLAGLVYAGNHGLEISGPGLLFVEPTAAGCCDAITTLAEKLSAKLSSVPGVMVENKGLTLTVHFRQAEPDAFEEVRRAVHTTLAASDHPFHLTSGNKVFDVRPRVDWDKGHAIYWIKENAGLTAPLTIYIGDDVTDEDAFKVLREDVTVKVGPPDETLAQYFVEGPDEVLAFLEWLVETQLDPTKRESIDRRQPNRAT